MFLSRGWRSFALSHGLGPGHLLEFKFDGEDTLSMKFFRISGSRLECCAESSSSSELVTFSESDDGSNSLHMKIEGVDSD
ncbi:hypothetical protein D1007_39746 [Hordeum vulgare]|nr:hypothetical protein D1007_39746 [Hordeum vulgare]